MIYKLKHVPTGLYYQPHKHRGSNLSKRGKIYQTATHGLSSAFRSKNIIFTIYCEKNSRVYKQCKDILKFEEYKYLYNQVKADTKVSDWIIEKIQ